MAGNPFIYETRTKYEEIKKGYEIIKNFITDNKWNEPQMNKLRQIREKYKSARTAAGKKKYTE
jgi:hypothetical protein